MEAIGNLRIPLLEYLVSRGADLDRVRPSRNSGSARSLARSLVLHLHDPRTAEVRRMLEICAAGTVEEILAERKAKRPSPPPLGEWATRVVHLAGDDAGRLGQSAVTTENLLVGLLRFGDGAYAQHVLATGADMSRLRARIGDRLLPDRGPLVGQGLPTDSFAEAALRVAAAEADAHYREAVEPHHLLIGIRRPGRVRAYSPKWGHPTHGRGRFCKQLSSDAQADASKLWRNPANVGHGPT